MLYAAFNVVKDAEVRERIEKKKVGSSVDAAVKVIPGAFESVLNVTWRYAESGHVDKPLGMRVVDSPPEYVWPDAEVDTTQVLEPTEDVDEEHGGRLELLVLSSPKLDNYKSWMKQSSAMSIYINCYTTREMKAFFALQEWCRRGTEECHNACGAEIEQRWSVVERRIAEVGPILRYVFDDTKYNERCRDVSVALSNINDVDMERYMRILLSKVQWTEDGTTHQIIKLVRAASDPVEDCRNFPASEVIGAKLKSFVVNHFFKRSYLAKALEMPGLVAEVLEKFGSCAFMYESVVDKVAEKMKCLPSALCSHASGSVLKRLRAAARHAQHHQVIAFKIGDQRRGVSLEAKDLRTGVLYIPDLVNFPVLDAFYFVDAPPQDATAVGRAGARGACASWTIVCLQMTKQDNHDTTTGAVVGLMARMREWIRDWDVVKEQLSWEMIYVQHRDAEAMSRRQVCEMAAGEVREEHQDAHAFWNRVEQYQVQMDNDLLAAIMLAAGCEPTEAELHADDVEEFI
ncbi:putative retrotransposon hot spot protein 4 (RHS4) [Trypanosoma vivax]|uniref:Retrotransposon hot spot protein (RHS), putative n=1 Tax=Trypanosoma vivax (strain Y486) TaxID=1055687 RepID=F9WRY6_TRYVY|nr:putative retrotransposon hot spot protein 4 (RHS4) [Trypanosoma vivax]CCD20322.1 retrotransposon hot spot protein (RHS), putative [Trypanosoma vivax Y486]|eukprot:CCD20322.1 retrotransposon hot spot protein (RHS), putative [Trypanosoma vivax Y486]